MIIIAMFIHNCNTAIENGKWQIRYKEKIMLLLCLEYANQIIIYRRWGCELKSMVPADCQVDTEKKGYLRVLNC